MNAVQEKRVQGIPVSEIAEHYGTPLYIYDGEALAQRYSALRDALPPSLHIFYSVKANPNVSICALFKHLGAGAEVSSEAELATARWAGVAPENIVFVGPGKSEHELRTCIREGIHAVVCESLEELRQLDGLAGVEGVRSRVQALLRVNPDFDVKGAGLTMGGKPRQFGIDVAELRRRRDLVAELRNVQVRGIHVYVGTRFLDHADIVQNTQRVLSLARALSDELDIPLMTVDVGGGLGVAYFEGENDLDFTSLTAGLKAAVDTFSEQEPHCRIVMELGRYLTATAGTYVVRARYLKESMGERFVITDGGTHQHMAGAGIAGLVKRNFPIRSLSRYDEVGDDTYTVTGPLCTPGDVIGRRVKLPSVLPGDLLGVERSGAYGPTASPVLFLSHGFPAEVLVHDGVPHLVRARDSVEDMLAKQRLIKLQ